MRNDARICKGVCGKTEEANSSGSAHAETTDKSTELDCKENTERERSLLRRRENSGTM